MELVKINAEDYGLTETKAKEIEQAFLPMLAKMTELESEFNDVVAKDVTIETVALAKSLRLKYVKIRTATAKIHKEMKAYYLAGGRAVDGWKNAQLMASLGNEKRLMEIEKHFEIMERERKEKIRDEI